MEHAVSDAADRSDARVRGDAVALNPRARWLALSLLLAITIINFIDRQTVAVLAPILRQALHLSNEQYGRIVAAFQFGMMSGELRSSWPVVR